VGVELVTVDARVVITSVDTYLRFAEAVNRLDLTKSGGRSLPDVFEDLAEGVSRTAVRSVTERLIDEAVETVEKKVEPVKRKVEPIKQRIQPLKEKIEDVVERVEEIEEKIEKVVRRDDDDNPTA
jgi:gas vesicle structural protein